MLDLRLMFQASKLQSPACSLLPSLSPASLDTAGSDDREQLGSKNHAPLQKFAVSLLTYDISTIDHAW